MRFYEKYQVEEYYLYDPDKVDLTGWRRDQNLEVIEINGWVSPRLGIKFQISNTLEIYRPDGSKFLSFVELGQQAAQEAQRADEAIARLEQEKQRYQALEERLRAQGIDPEQL